MKKGLKEKVVHKHCNELPEKKHNSCKQNKGMYRRVRNVSALTLINERNI